MNAATAPHYAVPRHEGRLPSFVLAALMHAALFAFLWIGIRWQSQTPVAVEVEAWDLKAQQAAPLPVPVPVPEPVVEDKPVEKEVVKPEEAPPPVVDPEIALNKIKKLKEAKQKALEAEKLALKKQQLEDEKKQELADKKAKKLAEDNKLKAKEKLDAKKIEQQRQENMARIAGSGSPSASGTAPKSTGARGDPSYAGLIVTKIKSNLSYGGDTNMSGNPQAVYKITQLPSGEILSSTRVKSSGIAAYDAAVEKAIAKSSPLPRKKDGTVEREIDVTFNLKELP